MTVTLTLLAALAASLMASGLGAQFAGPLQTLAFGLVGLLMMGLQRPREAALAAIGRFAPAAGLFLAVVGWAAVGSFMGGSLNPDASRIEAAALASLGLAFLAANAAARTLGRRALTLALLLTPPALLIVGLMDRADGQADLFGLAAPLGSEGLGAPLPHAPAAAFVFGLLLLLGAFEWLDAIQRRSAQDGDNPAQRMAVAFLSIACAAIGLYITGASEVMIAAAAGMVLMGAILVARGWKRSARRGLALSLGVGAGALVALALITNGGAGFAGFRAFGNATETIAAQAEAAQAAFAAKPFGHGLGAGAYAPEPAARGFEAPATERGWTTDAHLWMVEGGVVGGGLMWACILAVAAGISLAKDRDRRPSRGAALALGVILFAGFSGLAAPVLAAPAAAGLFAVLLGAAAALTDEPGVVAVAPAAGSLRATAAAAS